MYPNFSEIMAHLRSYAVGESAEISLKSALNEARDVLRAVRKRREFGDSDIAVRTELSYARQGRTPGKFIAISRYKSVFKPSYRLQNLAIAMNFPGVRPWRA